MEKNKEEVLLSKIEELTLKLEKIEQLLLTQKKVLNFNEVMLYTNLSKSYLYQLTSNGGIPCYKPNGKHIYFNKEEIENWLLNNKKISNIELEEISNNYLN
tara:strand:- start:75 stop:377 length:303 start_codon:yes stop_codon:yes gene_type:complete